MEAYGLVGFFAALQAVFGVMDFGLGLTVNREMARLAVVPDSVRNQRNLLRTMESLYWGVSVATGTTVFLLAGVLAERWLRIEALPEASAVASIRMMGVILALQFPLGLYSGAMIGLQRQVVLNSVLIASGTVKSVGAALLLMLWLPIPEVFFAWHLIAVLAQVAAIVVIVWKILGPTKNPPQFDVNVLRRVWRYSAVVATNAIIGVLLTQLDKIILSRFVPLAQLGYYSIAASVAAVPWMVIIPINSAFFPRFAQVYDQGSEVELATLYHRASQLVAVAVIPLSVVLIVFSGEFVFVWTGSRETAAATALIVSLLVGGTMLNGIAGPGGTLQSATGWPHLIMYTNATAAVFLVPALVVATTRHGAAGAATVWVVLNSLYVLFTIPIMHRRLLPAEKRSWYIFDVGMPLIVVGTIVGTLRIAFPDGVSRFATLVQLCLTWGLAVVGCGAVLPTIRHEATRLAAAWRARQA